MNLLKKLNKSNKIMYNKKIERVPEIQLLKDSDNLIPTSEHTEISYSFENFNPVQSAFIEHRHKDCNFVICAATSAGKTVIAELAKRKNEKFLYLSPLKAIAEEKKNDWTDFSHKWSNKNICILTGDYSLKPEQVDKLRDAEIIILTPEMLDSRTRKINSEKNEWLLNISTIVIDEFHLIGYSDRGNKLEAAVLRFSQQNPSARIIALSATMPNVMDVANWLCKLNNKDTKIILSDFRPVKLETEYIEHPSIGKYQEIENQKVDLAYEIVRNNLSKKGIVFVHTKNTGRKMLKKFLDNGIDTDFHNADLSLSKRIEIQQKFNNTSKDSFKVIIATSTLAWGVNTPADYVVVTGLHRGIQLIDQMDVTQIIGRAGRIGFSKSPIGKAFILIPSKDKQQFINFCEKSMPIQSTFLNIENLATHVCSEITLGTIKNEKDLLNWYSLSLAKIQHRELHPKIIEEIEVYLKNTKSIKINEGEYEITNLGKISSYMYFTPKFIYEIYRNISILRAEKIPLNEISLSWVFGNTTNGDTYSSKFLDNVINHYSKKLSELNLFISQDNVLKAISIYSSATGAYSRTPIINIFKNKVKFDFDRIIQASKMIDTMYARWDIQNALSNFGLQVKYEIPEKLIPLVKIPMIGKVRASKLYNSGIKTREDFINKSSLTCAIIGKENYRKSVNLMGRNDG